MKTIVWNLVHIAGKTSQLNGTLLIDAKLEINDEIEKMADNYLSCV